MAETETGGITREKTWGNDVPPAQKLQSLGETVVAVPAYNEAATIGSVVLSAREYSDQVVVIDDGSTDQTAAIARLAGAFVLEQQKNSGKGTAIKRIFDIAHEFDVEELVLLDADWQLNPKAIPTLLQPLKLDDADVVVGSRYLDGDRGETPVHRRFGQKILDLFTLIGARTDITDSQSGYRAFNRRAIETLDLTTDGFGIEVEMFQSAKENELSVAEVPISVKYDVPNPNTENSVFHGFYVVDTFLRIVRDRHPLLFFGVPGVIIAGIGLGYGMWTLSIYQSQNIFYLGKALFSSVLLIVGILSIYSALLMNMLGREIDKLM